MLDIVKLEIQLKIQIMNAKMTWKISIHDLSKTISDLKLLNKPYYYACL